MKIFLCFFERPFKIQKNGVFLFEISFFVLEILTFFYYANSTTLEFVAVRSKHLRTFFGRLRQSSAIFGKWMNVCLYTAHITHHVSWRFTILLSEIGRQLVKAPLAAAISPFWSHSPTQPMHETRDRPPHRESHPLLFPTSAWVL